MKALKSWFTQRGAQSTSNQTDVVPIAHATRENR